MRAPGVAPLMGSLDLPIKGGCAPTLAIETTTTVNAINDFSMILVQQKAAVHRTRKRKNDCTLNTRRRGDASRNLGRRCATP